MLCVHKYDGSLDIRSVVYGSTLEAKVHIGCVSYDLWCYSNARCISEHSHAYSKSGSFSSKIANDCKWRLVLFCRDCVSVQYLVWFKRKIISFSAGVDFEVSSIYWNVEEKCRKIAKMTALFVLVHPSAVLPTIIYSVVCIARDNFDASKFFLPFHLVVPFDSTTMCGFYALCTIQYSAGASYIFCIASILSYFVCCCLYVEAICNQFNYSIQLLDQLIIRKQMKDDKDVQTLFKNAINQIKKAVELHVEILE